VSGGRARILTQGCKVNQYESRALEEALAARGYTLAGEGEAEVALVVINTCTVTHRSDRDARALIRRARREHPGARVVVAGCLAEVDPDAVLALGADLVVGAAGKGELAALADSARRGLATAGAPPPLSLVPEPVHRFGGRARAYLKVQDGCDAHCAYCIVPHARGPSRSLPPEEVARGLDRLREAGHAEVVLTGIHLGAWGRDLSPPLPLTALLDLAEASGIPRVRLSSIEPMELDDEVIERVAASGVLCPHLHVPLQSGSDAVLSRMGRPYGAAEFLARMYKAFGRIPDLCLGLDVIVGFPGETEDEFLATETLLDRLNFCYLHVFPYSARKGTPAHAMENQVEEGVKRERAARLRALSKAKTEKFRRAAVGRVWPALAEGVAEGGRLVFRTRHYVPILVGRMDPIPDGETAVLAKGFEDGEVRGETAENAR